jgi:sulfate permease, SulP family
VLGEAITHLEHRGITVLLAGLQPAHDHILAILGVAGHLRQQGLIFPDVALAAGHAAASAPAAPRPPHVPGARRPDPDGPTQPVRTDLPPRRKPYRPKRPG